MRSGGITPNSRAPENATSQPCALRFSARSALPSHRRASSQSRVARAHATPIVVVGATAEHCFTMSALRRSYRRTATPLRHARRTTVALRRDAVSPSTAIASPAVCPASSTMGYISMSRSTEVPRKSAARRSRILSAIEYCQLREASSAHDNRDAGIADRFTEAVEAGSAFGGQSSFDQQRCGTRRREVAAHTLPGSALRLMRIQTGAAGEIPQLQHQTQPSGRVAAEAIEFAARGLHATDLRRDCSWFDGGESVRSCPWPSVAAVMALLLHNSS